ncbi:uncharacterized protein [Agelaius tricolor]|uniref:uncharacterized protein isoform X2 n=1 Tax=Agelaius tricolor TaxID=9191 RepID=UPI0039F18668
MSFIRMGRLEEQGDESHPEVSGRLEELGDEFHLVGKAGGAGDESHSAVSGRPEEQGMSFIQLEGQGDEFHSVGKAGGAGDESHPAVPGKAGGAGDESHPAVPGKAGGAGDESHPAFLGRLEEQGMSFIRLERLEEQGMSLTQKFLEGWRSRGRGSSLQSCGRTGPSRGGSLVVLWVLPAPSSVPLTLSWWQCWHIQDPQWRSQGRGGLCSPRAPPSSGSMPWDPWKVPAFPNHHSLCFSLAAELQFQKLLWCKTEDVGTGDNNPNKQTEREGAPERQVMLPSQRETPCRTLVPAPGTDPSRALQSCFYTFGQKVPKAYWKRFGRSLNLEDNDITMDQSLDEFYNMMCRWQNKEGFKASVNTLLETLVRLSLRGVAEALSESLVQEGHFQYETS